MQLKEKKKAMASKKRQSTIVDLLESDTDDDSEKVDNVDRTMTKKPCPSENIDRGRSKSAKRNPKSTDSKTKRNEKEHVGDVGEVPKKKRRIDCEDTNEDHAYKPVIPISDLVVSTITMCRNDYRHLPNHESKLDMAWRILRRIHDTTNLHAVSDALQFIQGTLEENVDSSVPRKQSDNDLSASLPRVGDIDKDDKIGVFTNHKPQIYKEVTASYAAAFAGTEDLNHRRWLLETIREELRRSNCQFYASTRECENKVLMRQYEIIQLIQRRMHYLLSEVTADTGEGMLRQGQSAEAFTESGEPNKDLCIMAGPIKVMNAAKTFYRQCLVNKYMEVDFENLKKRKEKHEHARHVLTQVRTRGFFFVEKDDHDKWTLMTEADILQKIKQGIRDCGKKRKAKPNQLPMPSTANEESVTEIDEVTAVDILNVHGDEKEKAHENEIAIHHAINDESGYVEELCAEEQKKGDETSIPNNNGKNDESVHVNTCHETIEEIKYDDGDKQDEADKNSISNEQSGKVEMPCQESVDTIENADANEKKSDEGTISNNNDVENDESDNIEPCRNSVFDVKNADGDEENKTDGKEVHEKRNEMVHIESREETIVESPNADGDAQDQQTTMTIVTRNKKKKDNNGTKIKVVTKRSQQRRKR